MPDQYGRLNLSEIRSYVLRNLTVYRAAVVDPVTGSESGQPNLGGNAQFSEDNLNLRINSATTLTSLLINANNETVLAKEVLYDAVPGVTQYEMPPDLLQIRGLWWKNPFVDPVTATPEDYSPMSMQDTFTDGNVVSGVNNSRPTYRTVGRVFQLNQDPADWLTAINVQGILVRYIRRMQYLTTDASYLEFGFSNEAQEVIVWETTLDCIASQEEMVDVSKVEAKVAYWKQQLEIVVRNQYRPPEIRLRGPAMVKLTWSGH